MLVSGLDYRDYHIRRAIGYDSDVLEDVYDRVGFVAESFCAELDCVLDN